MYFLLGEGALEMKQPGCEAIHASLPGAEVKNAWSYTSVALLCLHGMVFN